MRLRLFKRPAPRNGAFGTRFVDSRIAVAVLPPKPAACPTPALRLTRLPLPRRLPTNRLSLPTDPYPA
jgi:hypothetical protein